MIDWAGVGLFILVFFVWLALVGGAVTFIIYMAGRMAGQGGDYYIVTSPTLKKVYDYGYDQVRRKNAEH